MLAWAQATPNPWQAFQQPLVHRLTIKDGLAGNVVFSLAQDDDGYLWIGTNNGLSRYDGQRFYNIKPDANDPTGLPDGYVRWLLPLGNGHILVGTNSAGLALLDTRTLRFTRIPLGNEKTQSVRILALRRARDGGVWIASDRGLDHFDPHTGKATPVALVGYPAQFPHSVFAVAEQADGSLWIGTSRGLYVRPPGRARFHQLRNKQFIDQDLIWSLHADRHGRLWVGTDAKGLFVIDPDGSQWAPPGLFGADGLSQGHTIRNFQTTPDGRLWISTYGGGVIVCPDKACQQPRAIRAARDDHDTLASNRVRDMLLDNTGSLWFGTAGGLCWTNLTDGSVLHVDGRPEHAQALMNRSVSAIFVDRQQRIWLGLGGTGLEVIDLSSDSAHHLPLPPGHKHQTITGMAQTADGTVWVAGLGVLGFDADSLAPTGRVPRLASDRISALEAHGNDLFIATYPAVYRYDTISGELVQLTHTGTAHGMPPLRNVHWMLRTDTRRWYATAHGLAMQSIGNPTRQLLTHRRDDPHSLPQNFVSMLARDDARKRLWVATKGGLGWLKSDGASVTGNFQRIQQDGNDKQVGAIALDRAGNVWATGDRRLLRVDAATLKAVTLSHRDGLPDGTFSWRAIALGPQGAILVGGSSGLTVILPDRLSYRGHTTAPLVTSRIRVDGTAQPRLTAADAKIALQPGQRDISVNFTLLDFRAPDDIGYSYRLLGFDKVWQHVPTGTPANAVYTNLPSGSYRLQLRARIRGLDAQTVTRSYPLSVAPMWYQTWWARALQLLIVLLLAAALVYAGLRWSRRRQNRLDQLIAQRTRELRQANTKLQQLATTDPLTGLYTRRAFMDFARLAFADCHKHGKALSMLLIDFDNFKAINDTHGHLAGDLVLTEASRSITNTCRAGDLVGRYGGDEIVVCVPTSDAVASAQLAERLREAIASLRILHDGQELTTTCSIGVATSREDAATPAKLLSRADHALYAAKAAGRNSVHCADAPAP